MGISHSCPAQVNSCDSDDELELLVELIGTLFFRAPMLLFVWGSLIVFLEFVLYFKIHVDAGFNCSMCLRRRGRLGRKRVIQRRFNVSVPRARVPKKASTLRGRSER